MTILAKVTPAPVARSKETKQISLLFAAILVVMLVAQLFTFDDFVKLIPSFNLPVSQGFAYALTPILVASELFAIPFLLRMSLSPAFRWLSMFCGWLVALLWFCFTLWLVTRGPQVDTVGFLGTLVNLIPGWWAVCVSLALGILAAWSSWGLWPGHRTKK